jgi:hypothetical protein
MALDASGAARFPFGDEDLLEAEIESVFDFSYLPTPCGSFFKDGCESHFYLSTHPY